MEQVFPFIREGLNQGEQVMVAVNSEKIHQLSSALGADAGRVKFRDITQLGQNPACIIPAWKGFAEACWATGRRFRVVGEPVWAERSPAELEECEGHEALLNLAFDSGSPWRLLCPYDLDSLPQKALQVAAKTHPLLRLGGELRRSPEYHGGRVA